MPQPTSRAGERAAGRGSGRAGGPAPGTGAGYRRPVGWRWTSRRWVETACTCRDTGCPARLCDSRRPPCTRRRILLVLRRNYVSGGGGTKLSILHLAGSRPAQPVSLAAIDTPMTNECVRVDPSTLLVESVGQRSVDVGTEVTNSQHKICRSIAQMFHEHKSESALVPRLKSLPLRAQVFYQT